MFKGESIHQAMGWEVLFGIALLATSFYFGYLIYSGKILKIIWQVRRIDKRLQDIATSHRRTSELILDMVTELNRPLHNIYSTCELLLEDYDHPSLKTMQENLDRLVLQLKQIQTYTEINSEMITVNRLDTQLKPFLEEIEKDFHLKAAAKDLEFHCTIPEQPDIVSIDPTLLRVCIENLFLSALNTTHEGKIYLKVEVDSIYPKVGNLRITVKDTSPGIDKLQINQLLEGQVFGNTEIAEPTRNNISIFTVKLLTQRMAGKVKIDSEVGFGTTYSLVLPVFKCAESQTRIVEPAAMPNPSLKILVVDDEPIAQNIIKTLLGSLGYRADAASDGQQAYEMWQDSKYDAIFMDIQMPILNGWEASRKIFAEPDEGKRPKIFALTSNSRSYDVRRSYQVGMDGHLTKPISSKEIKKALLEINTPEAPERTFPTEIETASPSQPELAASILEAAAKSGGGIDLEHMFQEYGHDKELVIATVELSFRSIRETLPEILSLSKDNNLESLGRKAHFIKGLCLNLFWNEGANWARAIEEMAKNNEDFERDQCFELASKIENKAEELEKQALADFSKFKGKTSA